MKTAINTTEDTPVTQPALRMGVFVFRRQGIDETCYYFE